MTPEEIGRSLTRKVDVRMEDYMVGESPAKDMAVFVFNLDRPTCKSIQVNHAITVALMGQICDIILVILAAFGAKLYTISWCQMKGLGYL